MTHVPRRLVGRPTRRSPSHRRWWLLFTALVAVVALTSCGRPPGPGQGSRPGHRFETALSFPRSATIYLSQHDLPPVAVLARYDLVVLDHEWVNRVPRRYFEDLRALNPRLRLLAYVNLVDSPAQLGSRTYWANNYRLWQFSTPTATHFPRAWLAHTASGTPVREYEDRVMTNLTDECPTVDGRRYVEYAADWVVDQVWSTGVWDGIFLDVWGERIFTASSDRWDIDGDGTDEPDADIYGAGKPLDRGLTIGERILRQRMPDAILVANGARTVRDGLLDGRVWESFADPAAHRDPVADVENYVSAASGTSHRRPGTELTISKQRATAGSAEDYRRARFALASVLMQNGYWAPMGKEYDEPRYLDELDGRGLGRGYLGQPLDPNPDLTLLRRTAGTGTGSPAPDVLRRDFEHGIVLVNLGTVPRQVPLGRTYRHLDGRQDRTVNDGASVDRVTIGPRDGVVLLDPQSPPTPGD